MILYRAMCTEELKGVSNDSPFFWHSKTKFFSPSIDFINNRVKDGKFGNSKFKPNKYDYIVKYKLENLKGFVQVSDNEFMLYRKNEPLTKVIEVIKL